MTMRNDSQKQLCTFCDSHRQATTKEAGGAAAHAETEKAKKYALVLRLHISVHLVSG